MLNDTQLMRYLQRLAPTGEVVKNKPTIELLTTLHRTHLFHVAFENLDIVLGKEIVLSQRAVLDKVLIQRRGGFCYELNYAFALLLSTLGFNVKLLAASVFDGQAYGPKFDHMLLLISMNEQIWIADVGFGDCFRTPILIGGDAVEELGVAYKITSDEQYQVLMQKDAQLEWQAQYRFSLIGHDIADFEPMCEYHQHSPQSHFTQKPICSIGTTTGRISLSGGKLIRTEQGERIEEAIQGDEAYRQLLAKHFDMQLPADADFKKLLSSL